MKLKGKNSCDILRILHGGEKIWILYSSGKNNISRVSEANEWDIVPATKNIKFISLSQRVCSFYYMKKPIQQK